ncbi:MAG: DUF554 domain-containing protein [Clostridioides sp.]|nr:DUF554 domain-containing protein [Clostridioides sp.]
MVLLGSIVNGAAIVLGTLVGILIKKGLSERVSKTILDGIILAVLAIGIAGSLKETNALISIFSLTIGGLIGELIDIEKRLNSFGSFIESKLQKITSKTKNKESNIDIKDDKNIDIEENRGDSKNISIAKGFVTSSLIFCVGAMSIVGALESGLTQTHQTLFAKSILDGVSSIIFAASMVIGVMFSGIAVVVYEGIIALGASFLTNLLSDPVVNSMTGIGSLLIIALSLNMLHLTKIKVANLLPAVFLPILIGILGFL